MEGIVYDVTACGPAVPPYVIDASSTGVYPADYEELVKQARKLENWRQNSGAKSFLNSN